jgi:Autotransporter beta-domain
MTKGFSIAKSALLGAAVVMAGVTFAGRVANAQWFLTTNHFNIYSCNDATYGTSGAYFTNNPLYGTGTRGTYTPSCGANQTSNSNAAVITATETLRAATAQTLNIVAGRIAAVRTGSVQSGMRASLQDPDKKEFGLSGGAHEKGGVGLWAQGAYTRIKNSNSATIFDGNIITGLVGIDKKFVDDRLLVGLSAGYETMSLDTTFNNGNMDSNGFMVVPYASWKLDDIFSLSASGGGAWINYDMDRLDPSNNAKFTGTTDAARYFGAVMLNADKKIENVRLGGSLGAAYTREKKDAFTETAGAVRANVAEQTTRLGQARLGGTVGYDFGLIEPYAGLSGQYDFSKTSLPPVGAGQTKPSDDDFGLVPSVGANFKFMPNFTGMIEGSMMLLRDNYKEHTGVARVRVEF